jgi:hypothetical protein
MFGSFSNPSPPSTENWTMASVWPDWSATTCGCKSWKNVHSTESSFVLPPHQASFRTNLAPVAWL